MIQYSYELLLGVLCFKSLLANKYYSFMVCINQTGKVQCDELLCGAKEYRAEVFSYTFW